MNEESIFTEALTRPTQAERAAYLDEACAGDGAMRRRIEDLLRSHEEGGSLLEVPAGVQLGPRRTEPAEGTAAFEPGTAPRTAPCHPAPTEAASRAGDEDDETPLDFLTPSDAPGSLGRLGHYEVQEVVGRGGMGVVLRAFDTKLHRVVAIKVMTGTLAASATARRRFSREAQAAAAVCHEHVVTIHAVEEDHRPPYLVMQFVEGMSLQEKLDREGVPGLREILRIGLQTAEGLAAAHKQGLVHRDIKPANILLENGIERVKITDFGLARAADDASLTQSGVIAGTPQYMSPEQAEGAAVDQRSDLFSLGSVLYETCTGRPPFRAPSNLAVLKRVVEDAPRPIREINPEIPDWLCDLIARLHAKDPARRPGSAAEVAGVLGPHLAELQQPGYDPAPGETELLGPAYPAKPAPIPSTRRGPSRAFLATVVILLLLIPCLWLAEATGVMHTLRTMFGLRHPVGAGAHEAGTVVVESDDPGVIVRIDGGDLAAGVRELRVAPGPHEVVVKKGATVLRREVVEVLPGMSRVVRVTTVPAPRPVFSPEVWADDVFHLPVEDQVRAVADRLKELNPGFDGRVEPEYKDGFVVSLKFSSDEVRDLSPLQALKELKVLDATGSAMHRGRIKDLRPLRRLRSLDVLQLMNNEIETVAPLEGLRLEFLGLGFNPVDDLKPLSGMPLTVLHLWNSAVHDLSPLAGMPLTDLNLAVAPVRDLSPLKGMPLDALYISHTGVTDLSPLRGLPLSKLSIEGLKLTDYTPLGSLRLKMFHYRLTSLRDVSFLEGMPLEDVLCDFQPERDAEVLRSIPSLRTINGKPAAEFWKEFDARPVVAPLR